VAHKTNAARLLDQLAIRYELREYEVDPEDLAAETVAAEIGLPPEQVFKTLVARGDRNGICLETARFNLFQSRSYRVSPAIFAVESLPWRLRRII
jgi:hypothetical protein